MKGGLHWRKERGLSCGRKLWCSTGREDNGLEYHGNCGDGVIGGFTKDLWEVKVRGRLCLPYWIEQAQ